MDVQPKPLDPRLRKLCVHMSSLVGQWGCILLVSDPEKTGQLSLKFNNLADLGSGQHSPVG